MPSMDEGSQKPTVLVVEDHPLNMKLTSDLLELHGFGVVKATDGESALQLLQTSRPDLILLDLHLPGMDGLQVFQQIKADPRLSATPVIALTASAMRDEEERIRAVGFTDYIAKPIDTKRFITTVRAHLPKL